MVRNACQAKVPQSQQFMHCIGKVARLPWEDYEVDGAEGQPVLACRRGEEEGGIQLVRAVGARSGLGNHGAQGTGRRIASRGPGTLQLASPATHASSALYRSASSLRLFLTKGPSCSSHDMPRTLNHLSRGDIVESRSVDLTQREALAAECLRC